jgi:hypothetical protein
MHANPHHRRLFLGACLVAAPLGLVAALSGCAGLMGPPVITLGETELNTLVGRAFPMRRRLMEVLELEASAPRLRLLPERNRLLVALSLALSDRLGGNRQAGSLAFDSALRFEPADQSVRLLQVRVQSVQLGGADAAGLGAAPEPAEAASQAGSNGTDGSGGLGNRVARQLAERALEDLAVYRLSAERQAQLKAAGLRPGAVTVTARGVEITLARTGV